MSDPGRSWTYATRASASAPLFLASATRPDNWRGFETSKSVPFDIEVDAVETRIKGAEVSCRRTDVGAGQAGSMTTKIDSDDIERLRVARADGYTLPGCPRERSAHKHLRNLGLLEPNEGLGYRVTTRGQRELDDAGAAEGQHPVMSRGPQTARVDE